VRAILRGRFFAASKVASHAAAFAALEEGEIRWTQNLDRILFCWDRRGVHMHNNVRLFYATKRNKCANALFFFKNKGDFRGKFLLLCRFLNVLRGRKSLRYNINGQKMKMLPVFGEI
jgi:hypothetical protein